MVSPEECLVLEDSGRGLEAAHRAAMHAIWVPDADLPNPETIEKADGVYQTLSEVIAWLKTQNNIV